MRSNSCARSTVRTGGEPAGDAAKGRDRGKDKGEWTVRVSLAFIDQRTNALSPDAKHVFLILESFARNAMYCWVSNETLMAASGKKWASIHAIIVELEETGWIVRVLRCGKKHARAGFILLKRASDAVPAADTDAKVVAAKPVPGRSLKSEGAVGDEVQIEPSRARSQMSGI